jgi:hypothetical protein
LNLHINHTFCVYRDVVLGTQSTLLVLLFLQVMKQRFVVYKLLCSSVNPCLPTLHLYFCNKCLWISLFVAHDLTPIDFRKVILYYCDCKPWLKLSFFSTMGGEGSRFIVLNKGNFIMIRQQRKKEKIFQKKRYRNYIRKYLSCWMSEKETLGNLHVGAWTI